MLNRKLSQLTYQAPQGTFGGEVNMIELAFGNELVIGFAALWTAILIRVRVGAAVRFPV